MASKPISGLELRRSLLESAPPVEKVPARRLLELLLDEGSFFEIDALVRHRCRDFGLGRRRVPGDGAVGGCGTIGGRQVYLFALDGEVFDGTLGEANAAKLCKLADLALRDGVPLIGFYDSRGARPEEGIDALGGCGRLYQRLVHASGVIPLLSVVLGPTAGAATLAAALADFVLMAADRGCLSLGEAGEAPDAEGGTAVHARETGVCHFAPADAPACLLELRELMAFLPTNNLDGPPTGRSDDAPDRATPEIENLVPKEPNRPYDMKGLIRAVADDGRFLEVHAEYARNLVVGFAQIGRRTVGILANQPAYLAGVLDTDASFKGARFVRFCDSFGLPIVTLVDVPGFLPGIQQEYGGIIKHGAKLLYACADATVPKVTLISRKAYGGAYAVMCSKHLRTDVNLAYPEAEIAVMGAEGAVNILYRNEIRAAGEEAATVRADRVEQYENAFSNPYQAAERGYIDAVIEPRETRRELVRALAQAENKNVRGPRRKHGNLPL